MDFSLTHQQRRDLAAALQSTQSFNVSNLVCQRIMAVLSASFLKDNGASCRRIARFMRIEESVVEEALRLYQERGLDALLDENASLPPSDPPSSSSEQGDTDGSSDQSEPQEEKSGRFDYRVALSDKVKADIASKLKSLGKAARATTRCNILLALSKGVDPVEIALAHNRSIETLKNIIESFRSGGLEDVIEDEYKGKAPTLTPDQLKELQQKFSDQLCCSVYEAQDFIKRRFDVELCYESVRVWLRRLEFTYRMPKILPGKADPKEQRRFAEEVLYPLLDKDTLYFGDAMHPVHNTRLGRAWLPKHMSVCIKTNTGRQRLNVLGAYNRNTETLLSLSSEGSIGAQEICQLLRKIRKRHPSMEELQLVLDNARYNRSKDVIWLAAELNIQLIFLPPYSPNLNLIERVWKFFYSLIKNRYFPTYKEFKQAVVTFLRTSWSHKSELRTLVSADFEFFDDVVVMQT